MLDSDIEREVTDWKAPGQTKVTPFHKAKDVAAFANHLGGALIIGACEGKASTGKLAKWEGMTQVEANNLASEYSRSLEQKCDPTPTIDPMVLTCPGDDSKVVLVINVAASLRLVGVKADIDKRVEGWDEKNKALVYPVRTGNTTQYLTASELPMYMSPEVRRVAIMLHRIKVGAAVKIRYSRLSPGGGVFDSVEEERNVVNFKSPAGGNDGFSLPLDGIVSVYETSDGPNRRVWWIIPKQELQHSDG